MFCCGQSATEQSPERSTVQSAAAHGAGAYQWGCSYTLRWGMICVSHSLRDVPTLAPRYFAPPTPFFLSHIYILTPAYTGKRVQSENGECAYEEGCYWAAENTSSLDAPCQNIILLLYDCITILNVLDDSMKIQVHARWDFWFETRLMCAYPLFFIFLPVVIKTLAIAKHVPSCLNENL